MHIIKINPVSDFINKRNVSSFVVKSKDLLAEFAVKSFNKMLKTRFEHIGKEIKFENLRGLLKRNGFSDTVLEQASRNELSLLSNELEKYESSKKALIELVDSMKSIDLLFESAVSHIELGKITNKESKNDFETYQKNLLSLPKFRRKEVAKVSITSLKIIKERSSSEKRDVAIDHLKGMKPFIIDKENRIFTIEKQLNKGIEKSVYQGVKVDDFSRDYIFVQFLSKESERIKYEIDIQNELKDIPHLMPPYEVIVKAEEGDVFFGVQKKADCDGSELFSFPTQQILTNLIQLAEGLDGMHGKGIIHGDAKPENFLIMKGEAFISDFGTAVKLKEDQTYSVARGGTKMYMPPELIKKGVSPLSDSFSFGVSILEIISHKVGVQKREILDKFNKTFGYYQLNQNQIDNSIDFIKKLVEEKMKSEDAKPLIAALDIANELIQIDEGNRITCGDAATKLKANTISK